MNDFPPLPPTAKDGYGMETYCYTTEQMHDYVAADRAQRQAVPLEPTEEMIQAGCLSQQATPEFATYDDWCDNHSGGIIERIRGYLQKDYLAMLAAAPPTAPAAEIAALKASNAALLAALEFALEYLESWEDLSTGPHCRQARAAIAQAVQP